MEAFSTVIQSRSETEARPTVIQSRSETEAKNLNSYPFARSI